MLRPEKDLPYWEGHAGVDEYVDALLQFIVSSEMLRTLCGRLHILDFLVSEPDLYETILPPEWRAWFSNFDIIDILDLLMREDIDVFASNQTAPGDTDGCCKSPPTWRSGPLPPNSLLRYIRDIRYLSLDRRFHGVAEGSAIKGNMKLPRPITVGMKPKKVHEVENFAAFIDELISDIAQKTPHKISHLVDFGSGQNYLGRALASPCYLKKVIAVESKQLNIDGAKNMDVSAKLAKKEIIWRNKKAFRSGGIDNAYELQLEQGQVHSNDKLHVMDSSNVVSESSFNTYKAEKIYDNIQYVEHMITDGDLSAVTSHLSSSKIDEAGNRITPGQDPQLMVISLHSCGNLIHHGIRSLILNSTVKAVAMVGCCYNLVTERLGKPAHETSSLRGPNKRLEKTSSACDPHGFPMSETFMKYKHDRDSGIRLNITARMMAVQAPQNWSEEDSGSFFTKHFYRALLQRLLVDKGIVKPFTANDRGFVEVSPRGWTGEGDPILIGSLRKSCYTSFSTYARGAFAKISDGTERGQLIRQCGDALEDSDFEAYEERYKRKKFELSVVWSLMAFSAGVLESGIVVDRWLFLKEQPEVQDCWVQSVFEYSQSPRNLVIVGIKAS